MLPKRLTWFGLGVLSGALGATWGYVKAREVSAVDADRVARSVVGAARSVGGGLRELVEESRLAVAEVEAELRADRSPPR